MVPTTPACWAQALTIPVPNLPRTVCSHSCICPDAPPHSSVVGFPSGHPAASHQVGRPVTLTAGQRAGRPPGANRPQVGCKAWLRRSPQHTAPGQRHPLPASGCLNIPQHFPAPRFARLCREGQFGAGTGRPGSSPELVSGRAGWGTPPAGTLAAGASLQDDDRRLAQTLRAAAGGAQLAQVGVSFGVAATHRLAAGAHTEPALRAAPHGGRGGNPEGHHAL